MNMINKGAKLNNLLKKALELRAAGRLSSALAVLRPLMQQRLHSGAAAGIIATVLWEHKDIRLASEWFARAVRISPHSERASLGLFHSLWAQNRIDEAFAEMDRFMTGRHSTEYEKLRRALTRELNYYFQALNAHSRRPTETTWTVSKLSLDERIGINIAEGEGLSLARSKPSQRNLTPWKDMESAYA